MCVCACVCANSDASGLESPLVSIELIFSEKPRKPHQINHLRIEIIVFCISYQLLNGVTRKYY